MHACAHVFSISAECCGYAIQAKPCDRPFQPDGRGMQGQRPAFCARTQSVYRATTWWHQCTAVASELRESCPPFSNLRGCPLASLAPGGRGTGSSASHYRCPLRSCQWTCFVPQRPASQSYPHHIQRTSHIPRTRQTPQLLTPPAPFFHAMLLARANMFRGRVVQLLPVTLYMYTK